jgi:hypothetical protein
LVGGSESFASRGRTFNLVFDQLVGRQVEHVILDCKVRTWCVNANSAVVIHEDDLRTEVPSQLLSDGFKRCASLNVDFARFTGGLLQGELDGLFLCLA